MLYHPYCQLLSVPKFEDKSDHDDLPCGSNFRMRLSLKCASGRPPTIKAPSSCIKHFGNTEYKMSYQKTRKTRRVLMFLDNSIIKHFDYFNLSLLEREALREDLREAVLREVVEVILNFI